MKFCVIKNTSTVIDGSENPQEAMLQNAQNAGFTADEVEILTEEAYLQRVEAEPKPPQPPTAEKRIEAAEAAILALMEVL